MHAGTVTLFCKTEAQTKGKLAGEVRLAVRPADDRTPPSYRLNTDRIELLMIESLPRESGESALIVNDFRAFSGYRIIIGAATHFYPHAIDRCTLR